VARHRKKSAGFKARPVGTQTLDRTHPVLLDMFDLSNVAILLDVDGTILDIAPKSYDVVVPNSLRRILVRVSERAGGALALVSGRPLGDIDRLFAPLRLPAIGGHGAEIRPAADGYVDARRVTPLDHDLKQRLKEIAARHPGVTVEDKGYSLGLHYRQAIERELEVIKDVFRVCNIYEPGSFELLTGKAIIEIKAVGFDKGTAVRELMTYPPFAGRIPIFVGDDITDEAAFAVMPEFRGVAISVGRRLPGVLDTFRTPSDVRHWLEGISNKAVLQP
jgi:trehalose 6-phosphate phosphatase